MIDQDFIKTIKEVLLMADRDISEWRQLAKYQCEKLDNNLGWCPTQYGIEKSGKVREIIGKTLTMINEIKPFSPDHGSSAGP